VSALSDQAPASIATALYCRAGQPANLVCRLRANPFARHGIQVGDQMTGERYPTGHYRPLLIIPPVKPALR
jgi:hypothetical protein